MLQGMPDFPDLAALNDWLEQRCIALWHETAHGTLPGTIADIWAEERAALMPLPVAFDGFIEVSKRVSPTCLISFERNRYSVPASFANRPVSLRVYPDRLVVAAEGNILCEHARVIQRGHHLPPRTIYDWRHYLAVVQRKPGGLPNGAPFLELPPAFRQLQDHMAHANPAATARWSISSPWCYSTMSRPFSPLLNWPWPRPCQPRPMC